MAILITLPIVFITACAHEDYGAAYKTESAIENNGDPATVTNTAGSPAEMNVGDIYAVTFDKENKGIIDFTDTDYSSKFILAVAALDTAQVSRSVLLADEDSPLEADVSAALPEDDTWKGYEANDAFDQQLRGAEKELSINKEFVRAKAPVNSESTGLSKAAIAKQGPSVGDIEPFYVLSGLSSLSSYEQVRAEIKCIGDNVIFYVDSKPNELTDQDITTLCEEFDDVAAREFEILGEPSDINGDGRFAVLMTPQVNMLGAMGGGVITGFFYAYDLYDNAYSNKREVIYTMVPDSAGTYGVVIPKTFAMTNLLPAVLPHELQHAINYNQKVFVNGGEPETDWLNEGMSHLAEDILGYGQENPSRIDVYMNNTSIYGPVIEGAPGLAERGASYLFLRYLYEQTADGNKFLWDLAHSELIGEQNLEQTFGGTTEDFDQMSEFILRWTTTLAMSSFNLTSDPRFSYKPRVLNKDTNHWEGACLNCNAEDGRGTILTGVPLSTYYGVTQIGLEPTAAKFYQLNSFSSKMTLKTATSGMYGATLIRFE